MHIIIAFLTAVAGLIWALDRFGVDVHSINPFNWNRRRHWRKKYDAKPIHLLTRPIEAAAVLIIGVVNSEGLVSREQKAEIMRIFSDELEQDSSTVSELFVSGTFMLKDVFDIKPEIPHILEPNKALFTEEQSISLLKILNDIASFEGRITPSQKEIIQAVERELLIAKTKPGSW